MPQPFHAEVPFPGTILHMSFAVQKFYKKSLSWCHKVKPTLSLIYFITSKENRENSDVGDGSTDKHIAIQRLPLLEFFENFCFAKLKKKILSVFLPPVIAFKYLLDGKFS